MREFLKEGLEEEGGVDEVRANLELREVTPERSSVTAFGRRDSDET